MLSFIPKRNAFAKPRRMQVAEISGRNDVVSVWADADVTECGHCHDF
jgi:hypothetical protein